MNMTKRVLQFILASIISLSFIAYAQSTKDAFIDIKKKTLKKEYKHLALAPISVAQGLGMPAEVKTLIEQEMLKRLDKEGFEILPPSAVLEIESQFSQLLTQAPATGDKQKAKQQAALRDHVYRELYYRYPVDGLVSVRVIAIGAPFQKDKAEWEGTSQKIKHKGDGLLKFITGKSYAGSIAASTIKVTISDRQDNPLYYWGGGIEVMMHRTKDKLEYMAPTDLWQDKKRITKAVSYSLKPL